MLYVGNKVLFNIPSPDLSFFSINVSVIGFPGKKISVLIYNYFRFLYHMFLFGNITHFAGILEHAEEHKKLKVPIIPPPKISTTEVIIIQNYNLGYFLLVFLVYICIISLV